MIQLVYGSDDAYIFPTMVSAASAAWHLAPGRSMVVHLFDAGVTDAHYEEYAKMVSSLHSHVSCVRHRLSSDMFKGFGTWRGSVVTYSRMFIGEILSDLNWAIYFDGDTLWVGDIGTLWDLRDETKLVQASVDPPTPSGVLRADTQWYEERGMHLDPKEYLCMGLMLANLKRMRDERIPDRCRDFMARYPTPQLVDQTVLNYVCRGRTAALPLQWGVFSSWHGTADLSGDGAIHYVNDVPWRRDKLNRLLSDIVLLWYEFGRHVLKEDYLLRYVGWWGRIWRRVVFLFLKKNQWILFLHPYLRRHLRNTHGLPQKQRKAVLSRFCNRAER